MYSPHMSQGGSPAMPGMMNQSPAGSQYVHSPASQAGMPSPAGGPRSNLAPSPMSSSTANTPNPEAPASQEDAAYLEKVKSLGKYIEPLRKMITNSNNDKQKLEKMKKLLDILSNPTKRMPIETLKKCEEVLVRMNLLGGQSGQGGVGSVPPTGDGTAPTPASAVSPFLEAIFNLRKSSMSGSLQLNHTLQRTFGAPLEAIYGPEISLPPMPKRRRRDEEDEENQSEIPDMLQGEIARLQKHFKVNLDPAQPITLAKSASEDKPSGKTIHLVCQLEDRDLPSVPSITVTIPADYPASNPVCDPEMTDYFATDFLERVQDAFTARLAKMPFRYTLAQLLNAWEVSVRAACSPRNTAVWKMRKEEKLKAEKEAEIVEVSA